MSAGAFTRSKYEDDAGIVHNIRIQPETLALVIGAQTNGAPAGAVTGRVSAKVSGGRREIGLNARKVTVAFNEGSAPDGYDPTGTIALPWLQVLSFASINRGATGTYLGAPITVVGKTPEAAN